MNIRKATKVDTSIILNFIKDLAAFENLSHEVVATEEKLRKTVFDNKSAEVYIAESSDFTPIGFALCFETYSTFLAQSGLYLEDLFVIPSERGKGYGTKFLKFLAGEVKRRNLGRFEWSVLNWNQKAIDVYEKIGAKPQKEWTVYRLSGDDLRGFGEEEF